MHVVRHRVDPRSGVLRAVVTLLVLTAVGHAQALSVSVEVFTTVPGSAVDIVNAGDSRLFVVEQEGLIRVVQSDGTVLGTEFIDISGRLVSGGERGLLGLAFDPMYASNGRFYVYYTRDPDPMMVGEAGEGDLVISRFNVTGNPNIADDTSESILLVIPHPLQSNHNGGNLVFGPDGYLYIGTGDGGGGGDPFENGQDGNALLGKMLRIDVNGGPPYGIPGSNPFVGSAPRDEIWQFGLRNPFRFSFDRLTGDLWIGDVGQNSWEEVDFQPASSPGGENWGWDCYEGNHPFELTGCGPMGSYNFPVHEYDHSGGNCTVIGGYVYRGSQYPVLYGHYLFADYCSGNMWTLFPDGGGGFDLNPLGDLLPIFSTSTFGQDINGELYIGELNGTIYHIVENTPASALTCGSTPLSGCRLPTQSDKALLLLKEGSDDSKDKLIWKWLKGADTTLGQLGDPTTTTDYALCVYSGTGETLIMEAKVPAAGTCGGGPCWSTAGSTGFKYKSKPAVSDGIEKVLVKSGAAGKAKALVKGKGPGLNMPALPLLQPVRVQLINELNECAEAVYSGTPIHNDTNQFKGKAD